MVTYKRPKVRSWAGVVAIVVFVLAMTITFADVYGFNRYSNTSADRPNSPTPTSNDVFDHPTLLDDNDYYVAPDADINTSTPVPEPTTLTLLGLGLGALLLRRRKK